MSSRTLRGLQLLIRLLGFNEGEGQSRFHLDAVVDTSLVCLESRLYGTVLSMLTNENVVEDALRTLLRGS